MKGCARMSSGISVALGVIIVLGLILAVMSIHLYDMGVARKNKAFLNGEADFMDTNPGLAADDRAWLNNQSLEELEIHSADGLRLRGYYLKAEPNTLKTAILAHGYCSRGKDMAEYCRLFCEKLGYNILIPDDRGHGLSDGNYIGMGWPDRKDYLLWIDAVIRKTGSQTPIILYGVSMGGATVLMLSAAKR
jgi:uncharacterized protein